LATITGWVHDGFEKRGRLLLQREKGRLTTVRKSGTREKQERSNK